MAPITSLIHQAQEIYLHQAAQGSSAPWDLSRTNSIARVQNFKETLDAFPREAPGEQVLIWATFVAASDCLLDEHKRFFLNALQGHYKRSGFANILRGVDHQERVWATRGYGQKWTSLLPQRKVFVM